MSNIKKLHFTDKKEKRKLNKPQIYRFMVVKSGMLVDVETLGHILRLFCGIQTSDACFFLGPLIQSSMKNISTGLIKKSPFLNSCGL